MFLNRDLIQRRRNNNTPRQARHLRRQARQLEEERQRLLNLEEEINGAQDHLRVDIAAQQPAVMASRGPNLAIPEFSGLNKEDFDHWIKQFELLYAANNWNDTTKHQVLGAKLRGRAFMIFDALPDTTKNDYALLVPELKRIFKSTRTRYVTQQYETRKHKMDETVSEYGCALYELGLSALSDLLEAQRDSLIRIKFMEGLKAELALWVSYANPKNFQEAMTLAERIEGLQHKQNPSQLVLLENINSKLEKLDLKEKVSNDTAAVQVAAIQTPWMAGQQQMPVQQSSVFWGNGRPSMNSGYQTPGNRMQQRPRFNPRPNNYFGQRQSFGNFGPRCYSCNRQGHISRNCPRNNRPLICQLCNRVGHMARDCQRRQQPAIGPPRQNPGMQWQPNSNGANQNAGQFNVNRIMAIQYQTKAEDEQFVDKEFEGGDFRSAS